MHRLHAVSTAPLPARETSPASYGRRKRPSAEVQHLDRRRVHPHPGPQFPVPSLFALHHAESSLQRPRLDDNQRRLRVQPGDDPNLSSPSENSHWMPEICGEPSARNVAIVLCLPASNSRRTRAANPGSACSTSLHATMATVCGRPSRARAIRLHPWILPSLSPATASPPRNPPDGMPGLERSQRDRIAADEDVHPGDGTA